MHGVLHRSTCMCELVVNESEGHAPSTHSENAAAFFVLFGGLLARLVEILDIEGVHKQVPVINAVAVMSNTW